MAWWWPWGGAAQRPVVEEDGPDVLTAELELRSSVFTTYLAHQYDVSTGSIDRHRSAATGVQTAAAAVGTLYTGALALVFGPDAAGLPFRALLTPAFLAVALAGSMWYLAYFSPKAPDDPRHQTPQPAALDGDGAKKNAYDQLSVYRYEILRVVRARLWSLHLAVGAVTTAVVCAAAPFTGGGAAASAVPDWPPVPSDTGEASVARYAAELAEVATLRQSAREVSHEFFGAPDQAWLLVAGVAVLVIVVLALNTRVRSAAEVTRLREILDARVGPRR